VNNRDANKELTINFLPFRKTAKIKIGISSTNIVSAGGRSNKYLPNNAIPTKLPSDKPF
jgi:hypothetical protein